MAQSNSRKAVPAGQMKQKKFDINLFTEEGTPEQADTQAELCFENLPPHAQETIIDLIVSIIATRKKKEGTHD